jgi:hypothetical protein
MPVAAGKGFWIRDGSGLFTAIKLVAIQGQ